MGIPINPKEYIKTTQRVLSSKTNIFETFPLCVKNIIEQKLWEKVEDKNGNYFKSFEALCKHPLWHGLELSIDDLLMYLKNAPDVKSMVIGELEALKDQKDNEAGPGRGKKKQGSNTTMFSKTEDKPKQSRGTTYLSKRLKRDNPELFSKVASGELSAHRAAVLAGIKKPMLQVRADDLQAALDKLLKYYSKSDIAAAIENIQ
ncbi:hypothetical protein MTBBW1_2620009 [Desulfamplus magnetovallimortis]|uniref:Uncharacterized protein n=1 Tax=Desulfamplus magnetovallimortis TaxID=1246637 RepID=A0A1W1HF95_9BACT|nr:hypothetical protein [Desulfamplus magnetovallimortis]SLM31045.1 hypothetical protein MTBBW1_2620009 [Desulfamplus magnetovallimortis]